VTTTPATTEPPVTTTPATTTITSYAEPNKYIPFEIVENALNDDEPYIVLTEETGTLISAEELQAIKDNGVPVQIELPNGLVIIIDPEKISDDANHLDINIDIVIANEETNVRNVIILANSIIILPNAKGEFGFEIKFTLTAEQLKNAGLNRDNIKLRHVDDNGKYSERGKLKINNDGSAQITIDHASFYVLSANKTESGSNNNPYTSVTICIVPALLAGGALTLSRKKKTDKKG